MTTIIDLKPSQSERPEIVRAIHFDPWPFEDEEVILLDGALYIDSDGDLLGAEEQGTLSGGSALYSGDYPILVVLSDGRIAATSAEGLKAYDAG